MASGEARVWASGGRRTVAEETRGMGASWRPFSSTVLEELGRGAEREACGVSE